MRRAFVEHVGGLAEHQESMCTSRWYVNHRRLIPAQFHPHIVEISGGFGVNIDRHIEDSAAQASDQFTLLRWRVLVVETAKGPLFGMTLVVLNKRRCDPCRRE